jgi:DNA polymerase-3 subunit beta
MSKAVAQRSNPHEYVNATMATQALRDEVEFVMQACTSRSTIPIRRDVTLTFAPGRVDLLATNLDVTLRASVEAETSDNKGNGVSVNAADLAAILRSLPSADPLTLVINDNEGQLEIRNNSEKVAIVVRLDTGNIEDFPTCPKAPTRGGRVIDRDLFLRLLSRAEFSTTEEETRFQLHGALLEIVGGVVHLVATDGHRLSVCKAAADGLTDLTAMIRRTAVDSLATLPQGKLRFGLDKDAANIWFASGHIWFASGHRAVLCRAIDVNFPNWRDVIAKDNDRIVTIDRLTLLAALDRVAVTTNPRHRGIRLDISKNHLTIASHNVEVGSSSAELSCDYHGPKFFAAFNLQYVRQFLTAVEGETVTFAMKDENGQLIATAPDDPVDFTYVVMPMRLS